MKMRNEDEESNWKENKFGFDLLEQDRKERDVKRKRCDVRFYSPFWGPLLHLSVDFPLVPCLFSWRSRWCDVQFLSFSPATTALDLATSSWKLVWWKIHEALFNSRLESKSWGKEEKIHSNVLSILEGKKSSQRRRDFISVQESYSVSGQKSQIPIRKERGDITPWELKRITQWAFLCVDVLWLCESVSLWKGWFVNSGRRCYCCWGKRRDQRDKMWNHNLFIRKSNNWLITLFPKQTSFWSVCFVRHKQFRSASADFGSDCLVPFLYNDWLELRFFNAHNDARSGTKGIRRRRKGRLSGWKVISMSDERKWHHMQLFSSSIFHHSITIAYSAVKSAPSSMMMRDPCLSLSPSAVWVCRDEMGKDALHLISRIHTRLNATENHS